VRSTVRVADVVQRRRAQLGTARYLDRRLRFIKTMSLMRDTEPFCPNGAPLTYSANTFSAPALLSAAC
jgi:hypothetical protein